MNYFNGQQTFSKFFFAIKSIQEIKNKLLITKKIKKGREGLNEAL